MEEVSNLLTPSGVLPLLELFKISYVILKRANTLDLIYREKWYLSI